MPNHVILRDTVGQQRMFLFFYYFIKCATAILCYNNKSHKNKKMLTY